MPVRTKALDKKNGEPYRGPEEMLNRWREHFDEVLNIVSTFDESVLSRVEQLPLCVDMDTPQRGK